MDGKENPAGLEGLLLAQAHAYAVNPDGEIIFWNRGSERMFGWKKEEAVGKMAHEMLRTEFPADNDGFTGLLAGGNEWTGELAQYSKDGSRLIVSAHAILQRDNDGKPASVAVINNDITDLKKAEDGLKSSEEKFRLIAVNTPDHILIQDRDLRYTLVVNPQLGLTEKDMLGKNEFETLKNRDDAEKLTRIKKRVMDEDKPEFVSMPLANINGEKQYFEGSYIPKHDAAGKVDGVIGYFRNVTDRRLVEDAFAGQQQELQAIIDSVPASIFYKDTENTFLRVNSAFCEMMDMPKEKLEGRSLFDIYPPEQAQAFWNDDLKVIRSGKPKEGIIEQVQTKNGPIWAQTDKIPYRDTTGRIIGIIGFVMDISKHRLEEESLKKFNRMLRAISSSNQALMHAKDEQEYINKVCRIIVRDCGYKMSWMGFAENNREKTVRPAAQAGYEDGYVEKLDITWADTERGRGPTGTAIRTGKPVICRNMMIDPAFKPWRKEALRRGYASSISLPLASGSKVFGALMIYSSEPDPFSGDEVSLLGELAIDLSYGITLIRERDRNRAVEAQVKRIASFPELNPQPISEIDSSGGIHYLNPAFKKFFPGAEKDPENHPWFKGIKSFFWALKGKKKEIAVRDIRVGDRHFLQTMVYMPGEETIRTYGVEITKIKEAEQKLQKLYRELEIKVAQRTMELLATKHLADIGTLAATVAHELRNPLGVINVAAYNLRKKNRDRGLIKHISSIEKKVAEGSQIINNLLVYSRMKMPQFEKTDIYRLLSECADSVKKHFGARKIKIKKALQPLKGMNVDADALQLREVFTNLITNAYQAIEAGKGAVEVKGSVISGNGIAISVKDTGTGINREDMGNIFKPFFTRKTKGTGLGLVICRDLINMHNGSIDVKSRPGKGSTFTVTIPVRRNT